MRNAEEIEYSDKYFDEEFEYRHVLLPRATASKLEGFKLISEEKCKEFGIKQSRGWIHYGFHRSVLNTF